MIIIPARLHSTRFSQKMLTDILGYPMVVRTALMANEVDVAVVATDSEVIADVCKSYGIQTVLTDSRHSSGTDRCAEAARKMGLDADEIVINMQGDEPFLESEILKKLQDMMHTSDAFMGTCIRSISSTQAQDPNIVKVVLDAEDRALYFSRALIPFDREGFANTSYYGHLGIYAFRNQNLQQFCTMPKSPLEEIEKLEQLRALWNQKTIQTLLVETQSIGIDTPEDKERAIALFQSKGM
ncbi:3-deoxy-manno-octulosonate cytidylyltransferase [Helicobacter pametensis]|uniref:3-deoxy-manno-octulosonate cytidylyltransferase n=1 Tax=Helicobacter pametensis TaxID=95149 RepID=UPI0004883B95|nr:3-deoxy-manno-octulosonate cytidylyltransferase [Helicobacter pametensis]